MQIIVRGLLCCLFCTASALCANSAPVVNAGPDTTTTMSRKFAFKGSVTDDTLPNNTLASEWTLLSGPTGASISQPGYYATPVVFTKTGSYQFLLTATDGALSDSDSVIITVTDSIPFLVLKPRPHETIHVGSTYTIQWQVDPFGAAMTVALATDGGMVYTYLIEGAVRNTDRFEWVVSEDLPNSDSCYIRIRDYKDLGFATVIGPFTITNVPGNVRNGVAPFPTAHTTSSQEMFEVSGRRLGIAHQGQANAARSGIAVVKNRTVSSKQVLSKE